MTACSQKSRVAGASPGRQATAAAALFADESGSGGCGVAGAPAPGAPGRGPGSLPSAVNENGAEAVGSCVVSVPATVEQLNAAPLAPQIAHAHAHRIVKHSVNRTRCVDMTIPPARTLPSRRAPLGPLRESSR